MATTKLRPLVALIGAGALLALAGCTSSGSANGPVTNINIIAPSNAPSDAGFEAVTKAFNAANPTIHATYTGVTDYDTTRSAQLSAGTADIFVCYPQQPQSFTGKSSNEDTLLAQAGKFVDLTKQVFMKNYTPSVLSSPRSEIDGKFYAVPTGLSYGTGVYYNETVFKKYGLKIPTTWDEFVDVMSKLKAKGVTAFGWGGKDGFPEALPLYGIIASMYPTDDDKTNLLKGMWDGSVDLSKGVPLTVMKRLQTIYDNSSQTSPGMSVTESIGSFAKGDFAMMFDGTWDQKSITSVVGSSFKWGMFPLPGSNSAKNNQYLTGKLELQLCASSTSKNKKAALKWLEFFSQPDEYSKFVKLSGFAPSQPNITTKDPFLDSISKYTGKFQLFWESIYQGPQELAPVGNLGFAYPLLKPIGTNTPTQAAEAAEAAWKAVR